MISISFGPHDLFNGVMGCIYGHLAFQAMFSKAQFVRKWDGCYHTRVGWGFGGRAYAEGSKEFCRKIADQQCARKRLICMALFPVAILFSTVVEMIFW